VIINPLCPDRMSEAAASDNVGAEPGTVQRDPERGGAMNDIICLNVGGRKFETTRQTLLHDKGSMLAKMFDPESSLPPGVMRDGAYFLDRDPESFSGVLSFLRTGQLLPSCCGVSLEAIRAEAAFFGIRSLEESVDAKMREDKDKESGRETDGSQGDEFHINVGGEVFVTTRETLCKYSGSRLANIVEGKCRQQRDKNGLIFLDEDPKDFAYILRALRNSPDVPTAVPKELIDNILNLRDNLEIREIKFGYREQSNSFVSEYFLSACR